MVRTRLTGHGSQEVFFSELRYAQSVYAYKCSCHVAAVTAVGRAFQQACHVREVGSHPLGRVEDSRAAAGREAVALPFNREVEDDGATGGAVGGSSLALGTGQDLDRRH